LDKAFIINEIKRTAAANGGKPLGMQRFEKETGIRKWDWYGKHWRNWGEALQEAGFTPNEFHRTHNKEYLIETLIELTRELRHFPTEPDLVAKDRQSENFPSYKCFERLGSKAERIRKVREYCETHDGYEDVLLLCPDEPIERESPLRDRPAPTELGSVYLMKSGRYYKIGKTNAVGRRERELAIQLPEKVSCVHEIRTDDPAGIEAYWHRRFADKRKNGEWFELAAEDVVAFKRRRFM
jgi:hypothetical protein